MNGQKSFQASINGLYIYIFIHILYIYNYVYIYIFMYLFILIYVPYMDASDMGGHEK